MMRSQVTIKDSTHDHLSGIKKPWEDRIEYPSRIVIYALFTRLTFLILLIYYGISDSINKGGWASFALLSIANLWIYGETLLTKEDYYRIGLFDGASQEKPIK